MDNGVATGAHAKGTPPRTGRGTPPGAKDTATTSGSVVANRSTTYTRISLAPKLRTLVRWPAILAVMVAACSSCSRFVEPTQFGISRSGHQLTAWFVECYAPPDHVSLERIEGNDKMPIWVIESESDSAKLPGEFPVGSAPPGYSTVTSLTEPLDPAKEYRILFARGEPYAESLRFDLGSVPEDKILDFSSTTVSIDAFTSQGCPE